MSAYHKDDGIYGRAEASICLNCTEKKCTEKCERLRKEKAKLKRKNKKGVK